MDHEALLILEKKGFKLVEVDAIALARGCIGSSKYRRGAKADEAPAVVDCSSFIKWLHSLRGIWLPRRSIQQRELGATIEFDKIQAGDVVFVSGAIDYYLHDPDDGVGHVGIATGDGSVVHAANSKLHVVESSLDDFVGSKFRGAKRFGICDESVLTFKVPESRDVEIADDLRWIILQSL
ncbi:MAG: NlpC/P60 family protein [Patescibacteria group bacterium]